MLRVLLIASAVFLQVTVAAFSQTLPKKITFYVGTAAGGGIDAIPRLMSRVIGRYLPSETTVIVSNMPGAGGVVMTNYIERVAPADGSAWGFAPRAFVLAPYIGMASVQFDPATLKWIGNPSNSPAVGLVWNRASSVNSLDEAKTREVLLSGTSPNQASIFFPRALNEIIGTKFKPISGYASLNDMELAVQNGEVEGLFGASFFGIFNRQAPTLLSAGKIKILTQFGLVKNPAISPDVPLAIDLARNDADRELMRFIFAPEELGYPVFLSSRVDDPTADAVRAIYAQVMQDGEFRELMGNIGAEVDPMNHQRIEDIVRILSRASLQTVQRAKALME